MKQLEVTSDYYQNVLYAIYEQGKDNTFSDVTLKCGHAVFYGHKCVLSTQSEYFNSFFQGNFSDSNASEIDLSSVFEDEQSFEQVMKFFYTGVVDFFDIFLLARYASFFQIKELRDLCETEMKKCVNLQNCVTYYSFSKSADYHLIEEMTTVVIQQRFHDCFIHQDDTLQLCPSDLENLIGIDCLINSSASDILEFIAKWVLLDMTTNRVEIGQQVLDYLKEREQEPEEKIGGPLKPGVDSYRCQLEAKLKDSPDVDEDTGSTFMQTFQSVIKLLPKSEDTSSEEEALFTLSKRKKIDLSLFTNARNGIDYGHFLTGRNQNWKTVYDVCLYRPKTQVWYNVDSIEEKPCYNNDEDILPESARLLPFDKQSCSINYIHGKLMFSSRLSDKILSYNCEKKNWYEMKMKKRGRHRSSIMRARDMSTLGSHVFVWNESVFVIKVKVNSRSIRGVGFGNSLFPESQYDADQISGVYFEIYKMHESSGSLSLILTSPEQSYTYKRYLDDGNEYELLRSFMVAQASKSMDEILVVCSLSEDTDDGYSFPATENCMPFVVNIADKSVHFFPPETREKLWFQPNTLFIMEDTDGFLVAVHDDAAEQSCHVVASYKYLSKELTLCEDLWDPEDFEERDKDHLIDRFLPMTTENSSSWFFNGSTLYHNGFQHVEFHKSEDGKYELTGTEYTPHPFTTLVAAVETKVNADMFKELKPSCFLG